MMNTLNCIIVGEPDKCDRYIKYKFLPNLLMEVKDNLTFRREHALLPNSNGCEFYNSTIIKYIDKNDVECYFIFYIVSLDILVNSRALLDYYLSLSTYNKPNKNSRKEIICLESRTEFLSRIDELDDKYKESLLEVVIYN